MKKINVQLIYLQSAGRQKIDNTFCIKYTNASADGRRSVIKGVRNENKINI